MNLVGKIFTVLIFLMCVVYGTFALMVHAAHQNWKVQVMDLDKKLQDAKKQQTELAEQKKTLEGNLKDELERKKHVLIALEEAKRVAEGQREDAQASLNKMIEANRILTLAIDETQHRINVLQPTIELMRADIKTAVDQRNATQTQLVKTNDDLLNAVADRQRLEKLQRELAQQIVKMREYLSYTKADLDNYKAKNPPEGLTGEVTSVPRPNVVEISLGADDGVRKGQKFKVDRPSIGKFIGIIEVISVDYPNRAVCRPDTAMQTDQIQRGDRVQAYPKAH